MLDMSTKTYFELQEAQPIHITQSLSVEKESLDLYYSLNK